MKNLDNSDKGQFKEFKEFLKTVVSFTGDLSAITCPAFFLNGLSLLEYGTYWGDHPSTFTAISQAASSEDRLLAICRWFISTLYGSYASRCTNGSYEKKPYNPILGEQFFCQMEDVKCVCEQVSHHPPISAFYLEDKKAGVCLNGHSGQKSKFKGTSIRIQQVGRGILSLKDHGEEYMINFPDLNIRGILTGSAYIELSGSCSIVGSNNSYAVIDFLHKPWIGGDYNHIQGSLFVNGSLRYTLSGKWSDQSYFSRGNSGSKQLLFDATSEPMAERVTAPISEQNEYESHRVWGNVTAALNQKKYKEANYDKSRIEERQRQLRKEIELSNSQWRPKLFVFEKSNGPPTSYRSMQSLEKLMGADQYLDTGIWTYRNSLHIR